MDRIASESAWDELTKLLNDGDEVSAIKLLEELAASGEWRASDALGAVYEAKAQENRKHFTAATKWYQLATQQTDDPHPHLGLARSYFFGWTAAPDHQCALTHAQITAPHSDEAAIIAAELLLIGEGVDRDLATSETQYAVLAKAGYPFAMLRLSAIARAQGQSFRATQLLFRGAMRALCLSIFDSKSAFLLGMGGRHGRFVAGQLHKK